MRSAPATTSPPGSLTGVHLRHHDGFGKLDPKAPGILSSAFADLHRPLTNCRGEGTVMRDRDILTFRSDALIPDGLDGGLTGDGSGSAVEAGRKLPRAVVPLVDPS